MAIPKELQRFIRLGLQNESQGFVPPGVKALISGWVQEHGGSHAVFQPEDKEKKRNYFTVLQAPIRKRNGKGQGK